MNEIRIIFCEMKFSFVLYELFELIGIFRGVHPRLINQPFHSWLWRLRLYQGSYLFIGNGSRFPSKLEVETVLVPFIDNGFRQYIGEVPIIWYQSFGSRSGLPILFSFVSSSSFRLLLVLKKFRFKNLGFPNSFYSILVQKLLLLLLFFFLFASNSSVRLWD